MTGALHLLHRAVEALRGSDPDAAADAFDLVEALAEGTPPAALGLCPTPRQRRDALIRQLAAVLAPGSSPWHRSDVVATFAARYRASSWRIDQTSPIPPKDSAKALLWRALKCGAGFPESRRHLFTILSRGAGAEDIAA